jgi:signal transduction histidine kinase
MADWCIFDLVPYAEVSPSTSQSDDKQPAFERIVHASDQAQRSGMIAALAASQVRLADPASPIAEVIRSRRPALFPNISSSVLLGREVREVSLAGIEAPAMWSLTSAPLVVRGSSLGAITLGRGPQREPFSLRDLQDLEVIAAFVALALASLPDAAVVPPEPSFRLEPGAGAASRDEPYAEPPAAPAPSAETTPLITALLQLLPDRLARITADGVIRDYRSSAARHDPRDVRVRGRLLSDVLPPEVAIRLRAALHEVLATRAPQTVELEFPVGGNGLALSVRLAPFGANEVLAIACDISEQRATRRLLRIIAEVNTVLSTTHDPVQSLGRAVQLLVPHFGDWATVHLVGAQGTIERVAVALTDSEIAWVSGFSPRMLARVLEARLTAVVESGALDFFPTPQSLLQRADATDPRVAQLLRRANVQGYLAVPIRVGARVAGIVSLGLLRPGRTYALQDLARAEQLAQRLALAIEYSHLLTQERNEQARVAELEAKRAAVTSAMTDGVITVNTRGEITFVNDAARRLHGDAAIPPTLWEYARIYRPTLPSGHVLNVDELEVITAQQERRPILNAEWRLPGTGTEERTVVVSAVPIVTADDQVTGAVMIMRDVTTQRASAQNRDDFLATVSRELRAPLTSIKGWTQLLIHRAEGQPAREDDVRALEAIMAQARALQALLDTVLDVAQHQSDYPPQVPVSLVDLVPLARQLVAEYQDRAQQHHLILSESSAPEAVGNWDSEAVRQIVSSLLENAIASSPAGGDVTVTVSADADRATIAVHGHGEGIPLEPIVEPSAQAEGTNEAPGPFSLNDPRSRLLTARTIAWQMGGDITVERDLARGTTYTAVLRRFPTGSTSSAPE